MNLNPFAEEKDIMKAAPVPARLKKNQRVLMLTADDTEDMEFFYPYYRLLEAGFDVDVAIPEGNSFKAKNGYAFKQAIPMSDVADVSAYALLYIPGGKAPAALRKNERAVSIARQFVQAGKPVAAICHGPQLLVEADVVRGRKLTGYPGIQEELEKAGAIFSDEALAIDGVFITSRLPGDLHRHMDGVMQALEGGKAQRAA